MIYHGTKKLLVIGASENIVHKHNQDYHYITRMAEHYELAITNLSIGGMSNDEIFHRSLAAIAQDSFDLAIVMWTSILRKSLYFADRNIDDPTLFNVDSIVGHKHDDWAVKEYHKLYYSFFCNQYVSLRTLVCQIIALECAFKHHNIPVVMLHDFDNYFSDVINFTYSSDQGFANISPDFKTALDFENRSDEYLNAKLNQLHGLISAIDLDCWIDFAGFRFHSSRVDRAADGVHAGPQSHLALFQRLKRHLESRRILS